MLQQTGSGAVEALRLHLGCGRRRLPGWTHVDLRDVAEISADSRSLPWPDNVASHIYSSHLLEHFTNEGAVCVLKEWRRVLLPGGVLTCAVPDFQVLAELYVCEQAWLPRIEGPIIGGHKDRYDDHKALWDYEKLCNVLRNCGYFNISRKNPEEFLPPDYDDYSLARINGRLISVLVEGHAGA